MQGATTAAGPALAAQRRAMVDGQIRTFDVIEWRVIQAFLDVPREDFLPDDLRELAYSDATLTLKRGSTGRGLLRPMVLARLLQGAEIMPTHRALVVAGETGYAAALLCELAASVVTLESDPEFTAQSAQIASARSAQLQSRGLGAVDAVSGLLDQGWPAKAPYDLILVQGAVETKLDILFEQLAIGGRLVTIELLAAGPNPGPGRAMRFDRLSSEVSKRVLFDATAPILAEFRRPQAFAF